MIGELPVSKEFRALVSAFSLGDGLNSRAELQFLLLESGLDWAELEGLLLRHRLLLAFCFQLKRFELWRLLPEDAKRSLTGLSQEAQLRQLALVGQLILIDQAFKGNGVEYLSLKGPVLGYILFEDPIIRHSKDLDLLVRPKELEPAVHALVALGYVAEEGLTDNGTLVSESARRHLYHLHLRKGNSQVELHWRVSRNEGLMGASLEDCFKNKEIVLVGGSGIPTLGDEDQLRYLSLHGASHCWNRLKWLVDLKLVLDSREQTESESKVIQLGVDLCQRLWSLSGTSPSNLGGLSQLCLQQITAKNERPDNVRNMLRRSWLLFRLHRGIGDKLCYLWSLLVWPPVYRILNLPIRLAFAYPFIGGAAWVLNKLRLIRIQ